MNLFKLFRKNSSGVATTPAKYNELEQAIWDSLTETPGDWSINTVSDKRIRVFNQKKQLVTYMDVVDGVDMMTLTYPFAELGHFVTTPFRAAVRLLVAERYAEQAAQREKQKQEQVAEQYRRALL